MDKAVRIGLLVERQRAYGRRIRFSDVRRDAFRAAASERGHTISVFTPTASVTRRFADNVVKSELYEPTFADARRLTTWLRTLPHAYWV